MIRPKEEPFQDAMARLYPEYFIGDNRSDLPIMEVTFQVTNACSLACSYCYQINKGIEVMPFEIAKEFIDGLFEGRFENYISDKTKPFIILDFIGCEPFLQPKLIEKICDYFFDQATIRISPWAEHSMISICTNGVHYFEPDVQHFLNKYKSKISLSITIDGNKELHDSCRRFPDGRPSYDLVISAAKDWMSRGNYLGSKITIAPENLPYMNDAIKHFIDLGYEEINANTVYEKGWTLEHAKLFYKELKDIADYILSNDLEEKIYLSLFVESFGKPKDEADNQTWCGGVGNAMLSIDPKGDLYPCIRYMESSLGGEQKPLTIGNYRDGIGKSELYANRIKCLGCITRRSESTDECFYCPIAEGCAECSAYNYQVNGTPNSRCTFICDMHKARMLANGYFWNKLHRKLGEPNRYKVWVPKEWALKIIDEREYDYLLSLSTNE